MTDAGFFRGTSAEQDNRFSDKEKKLLKQMKFADNLTTKIEMNRIKLEVLKPWISKRISELLGMDDDVVVEFVINQLEAEKNPDARKIQINLTGFLNGKNARIFTGELWDMLISAQESAVGIPASMVEAKKEEIRKRNEEQERINENLKRTVSRFNDKLKQERESPPPSGRRDRNSPESSLRDKGRSRSKDRDSKNRSLKPETDDQNSKSRDDPSAQNKRNYRSRRSSSASPETNNKRKSSRSRSTSRERRSDRRPSAVNDIRDKDRRSGPDRGRDNRDNRPRRSRSPRPNIRARSRSPQRRGGRSRSRSPPYRANRRSPSPRNIRRRSPFHDTRTITTTRPDHSHRDTLISNKRDSSAADFHKRNDDRSRSRTPVKEARLDLDSKKLWRPPIDGNNTHPNNQVTKKSVSPEPTKRNTSRKATSRSASTSSDSSSSPERKLQKSNSKRRSSSVSEDSDKSEDNEPLKKKVKEKKKKKDKKSQKNKNKKHKKHKKLKKSKDKQKSSTESSSQEDEGDEDKNNGIMPSERIAKSFLKLVDNQTPSPEELERKLREKALESMKKAAALNR